MKKKLLVVVMASVMLTGCGKTIPKLSNGEEAIVDFKNGDKIGGEERVYGLKEDGVGIPESTKNLVPQDVLDYVNTMAEKVKNGEIEVPSTK